MLVAISGSSGVGKTTLLNHPKLHEKGYRVEQKETLRGLIEKYRVPVPSMVNTSKYTGVSRLHSPIPFLQHLVDWQYAQLHMHTINKHQAERLGYTVLNDRCALDSFVYLMYDLINFGRARSVSAVYAETGTTIPLPDATQAMLTASAMRVFVDQLNSIEAAAKRLRESDTGTVSYVHAVRANIEQLLVRDDERFIPDNILSSLTYILLQYWSLIESMDSIVVLTRNPYLNAVEDDNVRTTDTLLIDDLEDLFIATAEKSSLSNIYIEPFTKSRRYEIVEKDLAKRVQMVRGVVDSVTKASRRKHGK